MTQATLEAHAWEATRLNDGYYYYLGPPQPLERPCFECPAPACCSGVPRGTAAPPGAAPRAEFCPGEGRRLAAIIFSSSSYFAHRHQAPARASRGLPATPRSIPARPRQRPRPAEARHDVSRDGPRWERSPHRRIYLFISSPPPGSCQGLHSPTRAPPALRPRPKHATTSPAMDLGRHEVRRPATTTLERAARSAAVGPPPTHPGRGRGREGGGGGQG